jgi:hypothetical protein
MVRAPTNSEIRSYLKSYNSNFAFGGLGACFVLFQVIATANGRFLKTLPIFLLIYPTIALAWYIQRKVEYIAVDLEKKTLDSISFLGLPRKRIPIASMIHIGTRNMFVGGLTVMTVTYVLPNGKKKTVNAGGKESLDSNLQKILDALVEINPSLRIPHELRR